MPSLKIAKSGKNIPTITDNRDYIFNSDFDYLKESSSGLVDTDNNGDLTITHNLGYVPAFTVFVADYADQTKWYSYDYIGNIYATSSSLIIIGAMGAIKSKIHYTIFSEQL